ncbi:FMN-binding protein, partial [Listeria monocytogenes]|nr:FMN-binding protein [Listeria monocytogenes]
MKDGVYTGVGDGNNGKIEVEVAVENGKIVSIDLLGSNETEGMTASAMEKIPAAIIAAQSADVDGVSGATNASNGIKA